MSYWRWFCSLQFIPWPGDERAAVHSVAGGLTAVHALELLCAGLNRAFKKNRSDPKSDQMRQKPPQKADKTDQIRSDFRFRAADQIRSEAKKTDQIQIRTGQIRSDRARGSGAGPGPSVSSLLAALLKISAVHNSRRSMAPRPASCWPARTGTPACESRPLTRPVSFWKRSEQKAKKVRPQNKAQNRPAVIRSFNSQ